MVNRRRVFRVSERIREIVAARLMRVADPRLQLVTVTAVVVSPDLREAKVYWNVTGAGPRIEETAQAFRKAAGYFRRGLAQELDLRFTPRLTFFYDDTLDTSEEVERLMKRIQE